MLRELLKRWSNHKVMVRWLSWFFHYLDNYFIARRSLPALNEVGLTCFRELVCHYCSHYYIAFFVSCSFYGNFYLLPLKYFYLSRDRTYHQSWSFHLTFPSLPFSGMLHLKSVEFIMIPGLPGVKWESKGCCNISGMPKPLLQLCILSMFPSNVNQQYFLTRLTKSVKESRLTELC